MDFWDLTNRSLSSFLSSADVETKTIDKMIWIALWNQKATNAESVNVGCFLGSYKVQCRRIVGKLGVRFLEMV